MIIDRARYRRFSGRLPGTPQLWPKRDNWRGHSVSARTEFWQSSEGSIALEDGKAARGREGGWVVPTRGKYTAWRDWLVPRLSGDTTCKQLFPPLSNSLNHTSKILCQSYFIFWDVFISTTQYKFNWALNVPYGTHNTLWKKYCVVQVNTSLFQTCHARMPQYLL